MSIPVRNGGRVTGELSRGNELPNVFLERSRWLKPTHENILQAGQRFCPNDFLQGGRDTWRKSPWIDRDSLPQEMGVRVPTIGCSRWHHSPKLDANIDARCRGPLSWNGEANRSYRPARRMKAANLVLCTRYLCCRRRRRRGRGCRCAL